MTHSERDVPRTGLDTGATQPLQPDAIVPSERVAPPAPLAPAGAAMPTATPVAQPATQWVPPAPPPIANFNTAAVQVNNVVAAPSIHLSLQQHKTPFLARALWFVCIGWWLSGLTIIVSYIFLGLIFTIPVGIKLLHQVPKIQTLRDRTREFQTHIVNGQVVIREGTVAQRPFWMRALWFLCIGWWLTAIWLVVAWLLSLPIITLPASIMMIDRAPGILTLQKF